MSVAGRNERPDSLLLERETEVRFLQQCVAEAASGRRALTIVEGEAGIGKSALLEVARDRARAAGVATLVARGHELEQGIAGSVARQLIVPILDHADARRRARLLRELHPALDPLLEGAGFSGTVVEDPAVVLVTALATLFTRAFREANGVVMVVDDVHWADQLSLQLLSYLLLERDELPVAVVLALRPEGQRSTTLQALRAWPHAEIVRPAPLSETAVAHVVGRRMPRAEPEFCELCARATVGNPFLLDAMLRSLAEEGVTGSAADAVRLARFVPDSVLSHVLVRLARCSSAAADLARAVAVLGEAPLRVAALLAGQEPRLAEEAADELASNAFLLPGEPLTFAHPLVAMAVDRDQGEFARARAHAQAAVILDAEGAGVDSVASHLRLTRPAADAWVADTLFAAGRRALSSGDAGAACALIERALTEPPALERRSEMLLVLADARAASGAPNATEPLQRALELIDEPARRAAALYDLAVLLVARFDVPGATACARQGRAEVSDDDPLARAFEGILMASAGLVPELHDQVEGLIEEVRTAALAGRDSDDPVALAVVSLRMVNRGDDRAVVSRLADQAFIRSAGRPSTRAAMISHLGSTLVFVDNLERAEELLTTAIEDTEGLGRALTAGFARVWRAHARLRRGSLAAARDDARRALELRHFGWQFHLGPCLAALVETLLELGDEADARAMVETGEQVLNVPRQPLFLKAHAHFALAAGDPEAAISDITTANQFLRDTHNLDHPVILPWRTELARAQARLGERERAVELALQEAELTQRLGSARAHGIALAIAGTIARGQRGIELLRRAVEVLVGTPAALEHTRALVELGATLRRERERAAAREPLRRALHEATKLGAAPLAQRAADELRATGAHPRRVALEGIESLTDTEQRIAQLAASGLSNRQIADAVVITGKTVEWHLGRIYAKLGIASRGELQSRALRDADVASTD